MNRRCLNCMKIFQIPDGHEDEDNCCPFCGFIENTPPAKNNYIKPGIVINGRYIIGTVIGAGGFGITYRAWDNTLDSMVAIKEYFPSGLATRKGDTNIETFTSDEKESFDHGRKRFLREARGLARFKKVKNTVNIYDFFESNGTAYLVMEYLDGCNMSDYLKQRGEAIEFDEIETMADDICDALVSVHSEGIIHRDISPDNIFKCSDGTYKLIDFGAIKQSYDGEKSQTVILKHGYAPIEQYKKNGEVGVWTDIYAFAATIYKLLTNVTPDDSIDRVMNDEVVDICVINTKVPQGFGKAVMKALSVNKEDRYYSVEDFKAALHNRSFGSENSGIGTNPYVTDVLKAENSKSVTTSITNQNTKSFILYAAIGVLVVAFCIVMYLKKSPSGGKSDTASNSNVDNVSSIEGESDTSTEAGLVADVNQPTTEKVINSVSSSSIWKLDDIKVNTDELDNTTSMTEFDYGVEKLYFHSSVVDGDDKFGVNITFRFIFPDGSSQEDTETLYKGHRFYRTIGARDENGEASPISKGIITCEMIEKETGVILASATVKIK